MLMTSIPLTCSCNTSLIKKGTANWNSMCRENGLSSTVIEDRGGFQSSYDIAQQIATNLGVTFDGDDNDCNETDYNTMSHLQPKNGFLPSQWHFSECSASGFEELTWTTYLSDCLRNKRPPLQEFASTSTIVPGQKYSANQQ
ncbi:uncharacterized protein LOC131933144, partial [Physella acuta]|uniref:uncharacterized protein LOC131933144 n=1 Tax=Physella acuta TaxID=109671 RepID=UPI0027DB355E